MRSAYFCLWIIPEKRGRQNEWVHTIHVQAMNDTSIFFYESIAVLVFTQFKPRVLEIFTSPVLLSFLVL